MNRTGPRTSIWKRSGGRLKVRETRRLDLKEWNTTPDVRLTRDEVRALSSGGAALKVLATAHTGVFNVEASSTVGTVVGPNLRAVIHPKLPIRRVLYLLTYLADMPAFRESIALDEESDDLLEIMLELYTTALSQALRRGLVRDYAEHERAISALRGRIDLIALTTRRFGIFPPLDCRFSEFTADTEPNRRLLAAIRLLLRAGSCGRTGQRKRSRQTLSRLHALSSRFDEVSTVRYRPESLAPLQLDHRHGPFMQALSLADTVLRHGSIELRHGRVAALGFLVDMNRVYEHFVVGALRSALDLTRRTWVHHPSGLQLDVAGEIGLSPDALWRWPDKTPRVVLDVKYKATSGGEGADIYQMLAYCTALGLKDGILVYASATNPKVHTVSAADARIHVVSLDPGGTRADLQAEVNRVAAYVRNVAQASSSARR